MTTKFKKLVPEAKIPTRGTPRAAGLDLYSTETISLAPGAYHAVKTGLAIELQPGTQGEVRPRSGLAVKHGVTVLNSPGTIDDDYRGEVKVVLVNHGPSIFDIKPGDRIGQLVIQYVPIDIQDVEEVLELSQSDRGEKGFGSTGI